MKEKLRKLLQASGYQISWKDFERSSFVNNETLINDLNLVFADRFFDCEIFSTEVESLSDLPEMFVIASDNPELIRLFGTDYLNSSNRLVSLDYLKGKTILFVHARPRKMAAGTFIEQIFYLFPKVNLLIFLAVPFALIPAFYANIFNTRLIFNEGVYTLIFITILFISLWSVDYLLRYYVKIFNLKHFEQAALKIENYLLALLPFVRIPGLIAKWRMIESGRKAIWDHLSGLLLDLLVFLFILLILFILLGYFTFFLALFYGAVFVLSVVIRYRNYRNFIESEKAGQDMLLERFSLVGSGNIFNFDKRGIKNHFDDRFKNASRFETSVGTSNFYWEEFVRFSSFLASFVLFVSIFHSVEVNVEIFTILIALLILNSRASAALVGFVNKLYSVVISTYHAHTAFSEVAEAVAEHAFKRGVVLRRLESLALDGLTISVEGKTLLENVTLRMRSGDLIGLYGKVGAGKSLLAKTIIQQHSEYRGSVTFNGSYGLESIDSQVFAKHVAYIDAKPTFLKGSIYYNFAIRGVKDKDVVTTLASLIFPEAASNYDFLFQKDINSIAMSTGQAAKLSLFMGLSPSKSLVVIDEAFSNMPLVDVAEFFRYIKMNFKNAMFIVISHDRQILNMLGNVYEISNKALVHVKSSSEKVG